MFRFVDMSFIKLNNRQEKLVNKEQFNTIKYYDQNAIRYAHDTFNVSTKHLYKPFLKHIPPVLLKNLNLFISKDLCKMANPFMIVILLWFSGLLKFYQEGC